jgi:hypothetical protein
MLRPIESIEPLRPLSVGGTNSIGRCGVSRQLLEEANRLQRKQDAMAERTKELLEQAQALWESASQRRGM